MLKYVPEVEKQNFIFTPPPPEIGGYSPMF